MCGIVGSISRRERENFSRAVEVLHHRGPDAGANDDYQVAGWHVSLGHRRLSILDLTSKADQPFVSDCGNFILIYNGEIYNHASLRASLTAAGHIFRTRSDTEVLLKGIAAEGLGFLQKLNGMFAFAVLDKARQRLILARDPFGIKPLYLSRGDDGGLSFASELKSLALLADGPLELDTSRVSEFLLNGFLYEPASGFSGIEKVPPGCAFEFDLTTMAMTLHRYHDPLTQPTAASALDILLKQQVALEMEADVRVGVFFSGGIDSAALVAAAPREVQAFFVDYGHDQRGDARYVQEVAAALNTPLHRAFHEQQDISSQAIIDEFSEVALGTEELVSDYTYIATRVLSRCAKEAGFKVMLSGMGGDELFAGYPRHLAVRYWSLSRQAGTSLQLVAHMLRRVPSWSKRASRLNSFLAAPDFAQAYTSLVGYFSLDEVAAMTGSRQGGDAALGRVRTLLEPVRDQSALRQALYLDRHGFLAHNLTVTDRASMAESIEVRVPLLNPQIEGFARSLEDKELLRGRKGKLPLRAYLEQKLPAHQINRPKTGFNPPLDGRIRKLGRGLCEELVTTGPIAQYLDPAITRRWVRDHFDGESNHTYRIWQMIYFRLWLDRLTSEAKTSA